MPRPSERQLTIDLPFVGPVRADTQYASDGRYTLFFDENDSVRGSLGVIPDIHETEGDAVGTPIAQRWLRLRPYVSTRRDGTGLTVFGQSQPEIQIVREGIVGVDEFAVLEPQDVLGLGGEPHKTITWRLLAALCQAVHTDRRRAQIAQTWREAQGALARQVCWRTLETTDRQLRELGARRDLLAQRLLDPFATTAPTDN